MERRVDRNTSHSAKNEFRNSELANKIRKFLAKASRKCELSNFRDVNHLLDIPGEKSNELTEIAS